MSLTRVPAPPANPSGTPPVPPAPVLEELLLQDAKAYLRIDGTVEDALVAQCVAAAIGYLEGRDGIMGRALLTQTWDWKFDCFPRGYQVLELPLAPVQSVTSITLRDAAGVATVWASTNYQVDLGDPVTRILPVPWSCWPLPAYVLAPITVRFVVGYGSRVNDIPMPLRQAIMALVGSYYTARDVDTPAPRWIDALLASFRVAA